MKPEKDTLLRALADPVAEALANESGEPWRAEAEDYPSGKLRHVVWARPDGFAVQAYPVDFGPRATAKIAWPENPLTGWPYRYRDTPGIAYDVTEPEINFTVAKAKPRTLARRILRELVRPEYSDARAALLGLAHRHVSNREQAAEWRRRVSEAAGIGCHENGSGEPRWHNGPGGRGVWAEIRTPYCDLPGGSVTIDLPRDPADAAHLIARLRAVVQESE